MLFRSDTVHPIGTVERNKLRVEADKMFGPGTYDMKAGGYLALQAMAALYKEKQPVRPVELLLVPDEESGSRLSRTTIEQFARNAAFALVAEPARTGGHCVTRRTRSPVVRCLRDHSVKRSRSIHHQQLT